MCYENIVESRTQNAVFWFVRKKKKTINNFIHFALKSGVTLRVLMNYINLDLLQNDGNHTSAGSGETVGPSEAVRLKEGTVSFHYVQKDGGHG